MTDSASVFVSREGSGGGEDSVVEIAGEGGKWEKWGRSSLQNAGSTVLSSPSTFKSFLGGVEVTDSFASHLLLSILASLVPSGDANHQQAFPGDGAGGRSGGLLCCLAFLCFILSFSFFSFSEPFS